MPPKTEIQRPKAAKPPFVYREQYGIVVICADERDQAEKYDQLKAQGFTLKIVAV